MLGTLGAGMIKVVESICQESCRRIHLTFHVDVYTKVEISNRKPNGLLVHSLLHMRHSKLAEFNAMMKLGVAKPCTCNPHLQVQEHCTLERECGLDHSCTGGSVLSTEVC